MNTFFGNIVKAGSNLLDAEVSNGVWSMLAKAGEALYTTPSSTLISQLISAQALKDEQQQGQTSAFNIADASAQRIAANTKQQDITIGGANYVPPLDNGGPKSSINNGSDGGGTPNTTGPLTNNEANIASDNLGDKLYNDGAEVVRFLSKFNPHYFRPKRRIMGLTVDEYIKSQQLADSRVGTAMSALQTQMQVRKLFNGAPDSEDDPKILIDLGADKIVIGKQTLTGKAFVDKKTLDIINEKRAVASKARIAPAKIFGGLTFRDLKTISEAGDLVDLARFLGVDQNVADEFKTAIKANKSTEYLNNLLKGEQANVAKQKVALFKENIQDTQSNRPLKEALLRARVLANELKYDMNRTAYEDLIQERVFPMPLADGTTVDVTVKDKDMYKYIEVYNKQIRASKKIKKDKAYDDLMEDWRKRKWRRDVNRERWEKIDKLMGLMTSWGNDKRTDTNGLSAAVNVFNTQYANDLNTFIYVDKEGDLKAAMALPNDQKSTIWDFYKSQEKLFEDKGVSKENLNMHDIMIFLVEHNQFVKSIGR